MSDREGNIIDTESEPGAYADALRFPPYIFDGEGVAFNEAFQNARGCLANRDAPAIANEVIEAAFPETSGAAEREGADAMLRNGVIAKIKRILTEENEEGQIDFGDISADFLPIVKRLHGHSHYVPSLGEYIHVGALIAEPELLDEARRFKRQKGLETIAEADVLDELYFAVTGA